MLVCVYIVCLIFRFGKLKIQVENPSVLKFITKATISLKLPRPMTNELRYKETTNLSCKIQASNKLTDSCEVMPFLLWYNCPN